jgi:hypothetical protein
MNCFLARRESTMRRESLHEMRHDQKCPCFLKTISMCFLLKAGLGLSTCFLLKRSIDPCFLLEALLLSLCMCFLLEANLLVCFG